MALKNYGALVFLFFGGCRPPSPTASVHIKFLNNQQSLAISGIDTAILHDIDADSTKNWESLFAIYAMPADTALKDYQPIQPGRYKIKDSVVAFTPDTPFVKQRIYFLRFYRYTSKTSIWDYIKGKTTKGQLHYTDLIFKQ